MLFHHFDKSMWERVDFGDVAENKNESSKNPALEGITRVVGLDDMDSESLPLRRWSEIGELLDGTTFTRKFSTGQVLFGKRRSYQKKVSVPDFDGVCSGDILVFEAKNKRILNNFLPLVVQSADFMSHAIATSAGSLSPRTKWSDLAKYKFCLPSLKDQEKIIEIISSIDKTIEAYQDLPLRSQRESMLHELLSAGGEDWTETTIGEVALINPKEIALAKDAPFVPMDAVKVGKRFVDYFEPRGERSGARAKSGDVLFARITPCLENGKVAQIQDGVGACGGSTEFIVVRGTETINSDFIYFWTTLESTRDLAAGLMTGTTGRQRLSASDLGEIALNLPPLDMQKRIVKIMLSIDEVIQSTEQAIQDLKALRRSLLTEILSVNDNG